MTRRRARGARGTCRVCLRRHLLLKLGGYAVTAHARDGARCSGSWQQPTAGSLRYSPTERTSS